MGISTRNFFHLPRHVALVYQVLLSVPEICVLDCKESFGGRGVWGQSWIIRTTSGFSLIHPRRLTWNIIMNVWFRSFSFLNGWFVGSMLNFQVVTLWNHKNWDWSINSLILRIQSFWKHRHIWKAYLFCGRQMSLFPSFSCILPTYEVVGSHCTSGQCFVCKARIYFCKICLFPTCTPLLVG